MANVESVKFRWERVAAGETMYATESEASMGSSALDTSMRGPPDAMMCGSDASNCSVLGVEAPSSETRRSAAKFSFPSPIATAYNIYWLGLTIVLGGQLIYWNLGLTNGFYPFLLTTILVGSGYLCLTLCLAEMTSILPFAGGSYGYVRCTMGPIAGYLVGCCEAMEYVLYVATALAEFGRLVSETTLFPSSYEPLYWVLFYVVALAFHIRGGIVFWKTSDILSLVTLILIVAYLLSASSVGNFDRYVAGHEWFAGDGYQFFLYFPLASWFFVGVESMTLTCETVADPTYYVPKAMVACVATLFVSAICILFAVASVPPGMHSVLDSMLPLNSGYEKSWNISSRAATILALPGTFSTAFGFMFAYGKQIFAMSRSQLLPHFLSETYGPHQTPVSALLFGSLFGLCVLLILSYTFPSFSRELFSICMLGSCSVYVSIFRSYLVCADRYSNLERQFVSPLGRIGAIYGIIVFSVMVVSLAFFQDDGFLSIIVFTIFLLISLLYYFAVVRKREFFSDEEQRNFWKAYLLNATYNRRQNKGGDGLLRIWPGAGAWAANSPTALGPFPLPSGRLPSKQDPKVNPAADGREALRAPSGDSFAPSDPSSVLGRSEHKENGYVSLPGARDRSILTPYSVARRSASSPPAVKEGDRGDYLLALRFDWGDQRILLTETTTECLFRSSS